MASSALPRPLVALLPLVVVVDVLPVLLLASTNAASSEGSHHQLYGTSTANSMPTALGAEHTAALRLDCTSCTTEAACDQHAQCKWLAGPKMCLPTVAPPPVPPLPRYVPTLLLHNGVRMPAIACGTGGDDNSSAQVTVGAALQAGFTHIDTAHDYNDQAGVGKAIREFGGIGPFGPEQLFLTSKVPGCGVPTQGLMPPCLNNTLQAVNDDLALLNYTSGTSTSAGVDLMLVHFPPLLGCVDANCAHMQQQWAALEEVYLAGRVRAIGVSNYCKPCLECILKTARVPPMVNQMEYHVGMGADFGDNLLEFCAQNDIAVTAYSPLGGGSVLSSGSPFASVGKAIAAKYTWRSADGQRKAVQPAQVALAWVGQLRPGMPQLALVTKSNNAGYLAEDLALWGADWGLTPQDRAQLDSLRAPQCKSEAPGGCCKSRSES